MRPSFLIQADFHAISHNFVTTEVKKTHVLDYALLNNRALFFYLTLLHRFSTPLADKFPNLR